MITDAAKRMSEAIGLAIVFHPYEELKNGWMAFSLAEGKTDHTIYPSKASAIDHMSNEFFYCYVNMRACFGGMPPKDAQLFLELHREAYDSNMRLADPDAPQLIFPLARGTGNWPQ